MRQQQQHSACANISPWVDVHLKLLLETWFIPVMVIIAGKNIEYYSGFFLLWLSPVKSNNGNNFAFKFSQNT